MADDIEAHVYTFNLEAKADIRMVFEHLTDIKYLPDVAGRAHSWDAVVEGKVVAQILGNNNYPEEANALAIPISMLSENQNVFIHFNYNSALY